MINYSGIYLIKGPNDSFYGGSSANMRNRWYSHKHATKTGSTRLPHLYAAMRKYGLETFSIHVLVRCDRNLLEEYEQRWLDKYHGTEGCLNVSASAKAPMRNASAETLRKLSEAISKAMKGRPAWNKGVPRTEEEKEAIRMGTFANPNAHRPKLSRRQQKKVVKLYFDKRMTIQQLANLLNVGCGCIRKVLMGDTRYSSIERRGGWNRGKPHSTETCRKISEARRKQ